MNDKVAVKGVGLTGEQIRCLRSFQPCTHEPGCPFEALDALRRSQESVQDLEARLAEARDLSGEIAEGLEEVLSKLDKVRRT